MLKQTSIQQPQQPFINLPEEIIIKVGQLCPTPALASLAATCKTLHFTLKAELEKRQPLVLMDYVLNPTPENIAKAKTMIAANPEIMFIETEGYEKASGIEETLDETSQARVRVVYRKIKGSPFQAALGTGDSELYKYMATNFDKIKAGAETAQKQIKQRFPNGFDYPQSHYDFTALITALTNDQSLITTGEPSEATKAILKQFRKDFLPKDVTHGHHFNLNHLIQAVDSCNQNLYHWNENQSSLFWCQVVGYLQRQVPVVDAQRFCQEVDMRQEETVPLIRSLSLFNFDSSSNITYYPSGPAPEGLGYNFAIYITGMEIRTEAGRRAHLAGARSARIQKYSSVKTSELSNFQHDINPRPPQTTGVQGQALANSLKECF